MTTFLAVEICVTRVKLDHICLQNQSRQEMMLFSFELTCDIEARNVEGEQHGATIAVSDSDVGRGRATAVGFLAVHLAGSACTNGRSIGLEKRNEMECRALKNARDK